MAAILRSSTPGARRTLGAAAVMAGALAVWLLPFGGPRAAPPTGGSTVIAFGDSLVQGVGAGRGRDFVSLLSRRLGVPILNAGVQGDTTASALARLQGAVLSRDPRVVIVLLGGNDVLRRVPADDTFDNLHDIVTRIRDQGAAVVLAGISVPLPGDSYSRRYVELASGTSSGLVPDILDGILARSHLMADAIHPNDRGHELIADRLEPVLRRLIP